MSATKIISGVSGLLFLLIGLLGAAITVLAIVDPVGAKAADDNDPFGVPPSRLSFLLILLIFLCVCVLGIFLVWRSARERRKSA